MTFGGTETRETLFALRLDVRLSIQIWAVDVDDQMFPSFAADSNACWASSSSRALPSQSAAGVAQPR